MREGRRRANRSKLTMNLKKYIPFVSTDEDGNRTQVNKTIREAVKEGVCEYNLGFEICRVASIPATPGAYELSRSVVVYKAVDKGIAVLRIPAEAHVVVPRSNRAPDRQKLRTDEADVLGIVSENGEQIRESPSLYYDDFLYVTGETVTSSLSYDLGVECTHGIHSFKSFQPAGYWYAGVGIDMIGSEKFAKMKQEAQEIATEAKDVV